MGKCEQVLRMQHGWKPILRTTSQSGRNREKPLTGLCLTGTGGKFNKRDIGRLST